MSSPDVLAEYQTKLLELQASIAHARFAQNISLLVLAGAIGVMTVLGILATARRLFPIWYSPIPIPFAVGAARRYTKNRSQWRRLFRLQSFYDAGVARLESRWAGTGFSGEEFHEPGHVYEADLAILGGGSLFELLCTARTGIGRRRLARVLLNRPGIGEARARQDAVRELKSDSDLRERVALLGDFDFRESSWETFSNWLDAPPETAPMPVRALAFSSSLLLGLLILAGIATRIPHGDLVREMVPLIVLNGAVAWTYRKRTARLQHSARRIGLEIGVLREGVDLIARRTFTSARLRSIQDRLGSGGISAIRRLERLTKALHHSEKQILYPAPHLLIVRTQLCLAIEEWKKRHAASLEGWLDAWGEFEALAAISGYAYEHPADVFPEFTEGEPAFVATGLGHPLLPVETCVRNDVDWGTSCRFYIVSGSNMAGKSTLLRAIGLNAVLAQAGAPVRAVSLRLSDLEVCASLAIVDSLADGKSKFLAEVERLRQTMERARGPAPVLFLIDEILSGTNSRDRRIASEAVIRVLMRDGAIGALSTHDLALTELAELDGMAGLNIHMGSRPGGGPMDFDYVVKPGITKESNALAIVKMMGVGGDLSLCPIAAEHANFIARFENRQDDSRD